MCIHDVVIALGQGLDPCLAQIIVRWLTIGHLLCPYLDLCESVVSCVAPDIA